MAKKIMRIGCSLCRAEELTVWHYEDDICWIADCLVCGMPMVVYKYHVEPSQDDWEHCIKKLTEVANEVFGADGYIIDGKMRRLPTHRHAHARRIE